ncbi:hypothetical protein BD311DRAFT_330549 [Dichomitus squalens]|uniref:Uncharacterized protein n=1 Tax=Dichomitus squalens TaxID=114155 RepID=A0A4Q9ML31_9APHY|nr:hypothetical protein BD311DRAFT_330549 [Dichomitus squalens]
MAGALRLKYRSDRVSETPESTKYVVFCAILLPPVRCCFVLRWQRPRHFRRRAASGLCRSPFPGGTEYTLLPRDRSIVLLSIRTYLVWTLSAHATPEMALVGTEI